MQNRQNTLNTLKEELKRVQDLRLKGEVQLNEATAQREDSKDRSELLEKYNKLEELKRIAANKLEMHRANDPKLLSQKRSDALKAKQSANLWTDNIFTLQSYCANQFSIERSQFNEQFSIPEDFDYI